MEIFLYPSHFVRRKIKGPSECGKSSFLTNLILTFSGDFGKKCLSSPFLHQDFYQNLFEIFSNFTPKIVIQNFLNEGDLDL